MKTLACRDAGFDCDHVVEGGPRMRFWNVVRNIWLKNMV
jgi:hypothetical protein